MEVQEQNKQKDGAVKKPAVQTQSLADNREMYFDHLFKIHLLIFYKVPFYISYKKMMKYCFANICNALRKLTNNCDWQTAFAQSLSKGFETKSA